MGGGGGEEGWGMEKDEKERGEGGERGGRMEGGEGRKVLPAARAVPPSVMTGCLTGCLLGTPNNLVINIIIS